MAKVQTRAVTYPKECGILFYHIALALDSGFLKKELGSGQMLRLVKCLSSVMAQTSKDCKERETKSMESFLIIF